MGKFRITGPDGGTYEVNAPDGASEQDVLSYVQQNAAPKPSFRDGLSDFDKKMLDVESPATRALMSGATMGLSDEVKALGAGGGDFTYALTSGKGWDAAKQAFSDQYDATLNRERGASKEYAQQHPVLNSVLQLLGGVGGIKGAGAPASTTLAAPTTRQTALEAAKAGGAIGGVSGFASGEDGIQNRVENAATTGSLAALLGGVTPYAVQAGGYGKELLANLLGSGGEEKAQRLILRALERDSVPLDEAASRYNAGQSAGSKPEAMIDVGGENTRGLMRGAAAVPGPAKNMAVDFVTERQAGQPGRIAGDIESSVSPNTNYMGTVDDLLNARASNAKPLYERAYSEAGPISSDRLNEFLADPIVKKGLANGVQIQRLEALAEGKPFNPSDLAITGFDESGAPIMGPTPNLRSLDAIKRGLDDVLEGYRDKTTGKLVLDQTGRAINAVRKSFVQTVDDLAPESYAAARAAYAGPSRSLDALSVGRSILNRDSDVTVKQLASMTPGDREFVRVGLAKALRDKMAGVQDGADITKRMFGNPAIRERISAAFDSPDQFQAFATAMQRERAMYTNAQNVNPRAGSRTAPLLEEMADVRKNPVVQFGGDLAESGVKGAVVRGIGRLYDRGRGINPNTSQSLAEMLLATDPAQVNATLSALGGRKTADREMAGRLASYLRNIGALEGQTVGSVRR